MTDHMGIDLIPRHPDPVRGAHNIYPSSRAALASFVVHGNDWATTNSLFDQKSGTLYVDTPHGVVVVGYGQWVIRQADGTVEVLTDSEVMDRYLPADEQVGRDYVGGRSWGNAPIPLRTVTAS